MASHQFRSSWSGKGHALPVSLFLSYSLHHCGTSVIYIYFIKDKKKKKDYIETHGTIEACKRHERTELLAICI